MRLLTASALYNFSHELARKGMCKFHPQIAVIQTSICKNYEEC